MRMKKNKSKPKTDQNVIKQKPKKPTMLSCNVKKTNRFQVNSSLKENVCLKSLFSSSIHRGSHKKRRTLTQPMDLCIEHPLSPQRFLNPVPTPPYFVKSRPLTSALTHFKAAHAQAMGENTPSVQQISTQLAGIIAASEPPTFLRKFQKSLDVS